MGSIAARDAPYKPAPRRTLETPCRPLQGTRRQPHL